MESPFGTSSARSSLTFASPHEVTFPPHARVAQDPSQGPGSTGIATSSRRHWFYGPADHLGSPTHPSTSLDHEISQDEQQIEMYGGDTIRDPPPKSESSITPEAKAKSIPGRILSPTPSLVGKEQYKQEAEETVVMPSHSFASPSATLDANLVGWDGPDDPQNPQNWSVKYKWWITMMCIIMTVNVYVPQSAAGRVLFSN